MKVKSEFYFRFVYFISSHFMLNSFKQVVSVNKVVISKKGTNTCSVPLMIDGKIPDEFIERLKHFGENIRL